KVESADVKKYKRRASAAWRRVSRRECRAPSLLMRAIDAHVDCIEASDPMLRRTVAGSAFGPGVAAWPRRPVHPRAFAVRACGVQESGVRKPEQSPARRPVQCGELRL